MQNTSLSYSQLWTAAVAGYIRSDHAILAALATCPLAGPPPNSIEHNIGVLSIKITSPNRRCLGCKSKGNRSFDGQSPVLGSSQRAQPPHQLAGTEHQQGLQGHSPGAQVHRSGHNHVV